MNELIKSGDLSNRYGVSTRTLRYYDAYVKPGKKFLCKYFMNGTPERRLR